MEFCVHAQSSLRAYCCTFLKLALTVRLSLSRSRSRSGTRSLARSLSLSLSLALVSLRRAEELRNDCVYGGTAGSRRTHVGDLVTQLPSKEALVSNRKESLADCIGDLDSRIQGETRVAARQADKTSKQTLVTT